MTEPSFIIWSDDHKAWRSEDGGHTNDRRQAQQWPSEEAAQAECGEGEKVWRY